MPSNVEIKARLEDLDAFHTLFKKVYQQKDDSCKTLEQCDTFFKCSNGRLKLREIKCQDDESAELIFYDRSDVAGPKKSEYVKYESKKESASLKDALTRAHGKRGEVKKTRLLYVVEQTRVHIDKVDGVGAFVELEVELRDAQTTEDGQKIANEFMEKLDITSDMLVEGSYIDLLDKVAETAGKKNGEISKEVKKSSEAEADQDKEMKEVAEETKKTESTVADKKEAAATGDSSEKKEDAKEEPQPKEAAQAEGDKKPKSKEEVTEIKEAKTDESAKAKPEKEDKIDEAAEQMDTEDTATDKTVEAKATETPESEVAVDANTEA